MRSVATKIFITFAAALAAFAAAAGFSATRLHSLGQDLQLLSDGYLPLTRIAAQLDVKDWVMSRALEAGALDPAALRAWLPLARAHFPTLVREKVAEGATVARRAGESAPAADRAFFDEVLRRFDQIDRRWAEYPTRRRGCCSRPWRRGRRPRDRRPSSSGCRRCEPWRRPSRST